MIAHVLSFARKQRTEAERPPNNKQKRRSSGATELSSPRKTEANGCGACDDAKSGEPETVIGEDVE